MVRQPVYFTISDTAVYTIFDRLGNKFEGGFTATVPASPVMLGVKLSPYLQHYYSAAVASISQNYYSFLIQDSSEAILIAMGINSSNYKDFRYHVVENDSVELVPWSPVTDMRRDYGAKEAFAFIGNFKRPGKWITVEVYNTKNYAVREGVIFDWRKNLQPQLEQIVIGVRGDYFNLKSTEHNRGYATEFDKITNVPGDFRFPADSVRYISIQFKKEETRAYSTHVIRDINGRIDTIPTELVDHNGYFQIDPMFLRQPGHYQVVVQRQQRIPGWNEPQLLRIPFEITEPGAAIKTAKRTFLVLGITIFSLLISFWIYRRAMRRAMQKLARQKESAQLKLKSVQSQLNPHFIFNALSSIQNLMNKQATDEANHYLTRFAALTRAALDSGSQDMISLKQEWTIADNYLQMEQLRFGFTFELKMDRSIQPENIEVPPMLLQPLIENAVKHGIAGNKAGLIILSAKANGKDLQLAISDNGRGFDPGKDSNGFGLKLSRERLELLNSLYASRTFEMNIDSNISGTNITITLNNWL